MDGYDTILSFRWWDIPIPIPIPIPVSIQTPPKLNIAALQLVQSHLHEYLLYVADENRQQMLLAFLDKSSIQME
jgi:hypothetical protein